MYIPEMIKLVAPAKKRISRRIAIVGAGMAGITAARTLQQAGHEITVFEKGAETGGRMATQSSVFGSFDLGTQYFTVRDPRFTSAMRYSLEQQKAVCLPWSANAVRVLDSSGLVAAASLPSLEPHWVAQPGMSALVRLWAQPLPRMHRDTRVTALKRGAVGWTLTAIGADDTLASHGGFDAVVLALPAPLAAELLKGVAKAGALAGALGSVEIAPCWTLMLAFPNASQPGLSSFGPQWNAARSTHHRIAWLARESSKPRRESIERWTVQASADWSREHLADNPERVIAKLRKAFAEVTGIRAEPAYMQAHRWLYAKTEKPLGQSHLWDAGLDLGICGDWCLGHRVENAFVSGLELALAIA